MQRRLCFPLWEDGAEHQDSQSPELPTESTSRGPCGVREYSNEQQGAGQP